MSIMLLVVFSLSGMAESKTESFKVYGNCGMCKSRIEQAAIAVEGVATAVWNKKTKIIEVSLESPNTDLHQVEMAIAMVGHDTDMDKATDEVYNSLPGCCKYERSTMEKSMTKDANKMHDGCGKEKTGAASCCAKK